MGFNWVGTQEELEAVYPLPQPRENYRFILKAGIEAADRKDRACLISTTGCATLIIEQFNGGGRGEAPPAPVCPDLTYWVAKVQSDKGFSLMVLTTDKKAEVNLARPGLVTVWAHGLETTLTLLVAAAQLDPGDERLGHVITYCQHHGLLLPAFRPSESQSARTAHD